MFGVHANLTESFDVSYLEEKVKCRVSIHLSLYPTLFPQLDMANNIKTYLQNNHFNNSHQKSRWQKSNYFTLAQLFTSSSQQCYFVQYYDILKFDQGIMGGGGQHYKK